MAREHRRAAQAGEGKKAVIMRQSVNNRILDLKLALQTMFHQRLRKARPRTGLVCVRWEDKSANFVSFRPKMVQITTSVS